MKDYADKQWLREQNGINPEQIVGWGLAIAMIIYLFWGI